MSSLFPGVFARAAVVTLIAALLAGCGGNWRASTYDPRRACESFGGRYWERGGTCHGGGQQFRDVRGHRRRRMTASQGEF